MSRLRRVELFLALMGVGALLAAPLASLAGARIGHSPTVLPSLTITGGQLLLPVGSVSAPALAFSGDTATGLYQNAVGEIDVSINAVRRYILTSTRILNLSDTGSLEFGGAQDVVLVRDAANILAQRNGTTAQALRLYNTFTDASNYERFAVDWSTTSNVLRLATEAAGTGTVRNIALMGGNVGIGVTAPNALLHINGVVQWNNIAEPTCNSTNRGSVVLVTGGAGVADTFRVCTKDAADAYAYRALF